MNEEISRILGLLEKGKINAEEAERLIRAVGEQGKPRTDEAASASATAGTAGCADPLTELRRIFRRVGEAQMRASRRWGRWHWWRHYKLERHYTKKRRARAASMSTLDRVLFILRDRVLVDDPNLSAESSLKALLDMEPIRWDHRKQIPWELLRFALEDEFGIDVPAADLTELDTVQALIDYVNRRAPRSESAEAEEPDSGAVVPLDEPAP